VVLALFADDDTCVPANNDLQIQRIGAAYDLSAGRQQDTLVGLLATT
jgi:hypothetical protein